MNTSKRYHRRNRKVNANVERQCPHVLTSPVENQRSLCHSPLANSSHLPDLSCGEAGRSSDLRGAALQILHIAAQIGGQFVRIGAEVTENLAAVVRASLREAHAREVEMDARILIA